MSHKQEILILNTFYFVKKKGVFPIVSFLYLNKYVCYFSSTPQHYHNDDHLHLFTILLLPYTFSFAFQLILNCLQVETIIFQFVEWKEWRFCFVFEEWSCKQTRGTIEGNYGLHKSQKYGVFLTISDRLSLLSLLVTWENWEWTNFNTS